jgi:hypothetical protein
MSKDEELRFDGMWTTIAEIDAAIEKFPNNFPVGERSRFLLFSRYCYGRYCCPRDVLWMLHLSQIEPNGYKQSAGATGIIHDCERMFPQLAHLEVRRAIWCFITGRHQCEAVFVTYMNFRVAVLKNLLTNPPTSTKSLTDCIGDALWHATCHITGPLTPPAPAPPYTLYAFNIELPEIEGPEEQAEEVRLWSTRSDVSHGRRRRPDAARHAIVQNLLRLAAKSEEVASMAEQPRISEILEGTEDEEGNDAEDGGARLHGFD